MNRADYEAVLPKYPQFTAKLSLLDMAQRLAGPREAVWHAIIRKNYGCTHFIVGQDHAGPGTDILGNGFYGLYDAQEMAKEFEEELGLTLLPIRMLVYVKEQDEHLPVDEIPEGATSWSISQSGLRARLDDGRPIPDWFKYPEVARELWRRHPPGRRKALRFSLRGFQDQGSPPWPTSSGPSSSRPVAAP